MIRTEFKRPPVSIHSYYIYSRMQSSYCVSRIFMVLSFDCARMTGSAYHPCRAAVLPH